MIVGERNRVESQLGFAFDAGAIVLAYISRVCSASPTTSRRRVSRCLAVSHARRRLLRALLHGGGVLPALQESPARDAALFQLFPSPVDACGLL